MSDKKIEQEIANPLFKGEKLLFDNQVELGIQAKGLTAPRVTHADIEANIIDVEIVKHVSKTGQVLRWAVITTLNGFAVVGKPSCAVSSENDNAAIGEEVAINNSREELWPLMGYELRSKLSCQPMSIWDAVSRLPDQANLLPPFGAGAKQDTGFTVSLQTGPRKPAPLDADSLGHIRNRQVD